MLRKYHIKKWLAAQRPALTAEHAQRRLAFAQKHRDWSTEEWKSIIFSDECSIERGAGKRRPWVFRMPGQKYDKDKIDPKSKGKDISIIV